jgi:hypothetical protein
MCIESNGGCGVEVSRMGVNARRSACILLNVKPTLHPSILHPSIFQELLSSGTCHRQ